MLRQHLRARRRRLRAAAAAAAGATIASEATPTTAVDWRHHQSLGSQKADVYAFGIILYEVVGLSGPWGIKDMNGWDVQGKVVTKTNSTVIRRNLLRTRSFSYGWLNEGNFPCDSAKRLRLFATLAQSRRNLSRRRSEIPRIETRHVIPT